MDKHFPEQTLRDWGILALVIFIGMQALQVIIAPIPGELTGILGGFVFGQWLGFFYSTIGLTIGSLGAFWVGRWLGAAFGQGLVAPQVWERMGFLVEVEGAILCFIIGCSMSGVAHRLALSSTWRSSAIAAAGPLRDEGNR